MPFVSFGLTTTASREAVEACLGERAELHVFRAGGLDDDTGLGVDATADVGCS